MPNWHRFFAALFTGRPWAIRALLAWLMTLTLIFIAAKLIT